MRVMTEFGTYDVKAYKCTYEHNGNLAVQLTCEDDGFEEPFSTLTVNIDGVKLSKNEAAIDTNNNPWAVKFILDNKLGEMTGRYACSGFCQYPICQFYETALQNMPEME